MTYLDRTDNFIAGLGVEAYRVGGSVRDELLGRRVKDADYVVRNVDLPTLGGKLQAAGVDSLSKLKLRTGEHVGFRVTKKSDKLGLIEIVLPRTEVSTGPGRHDFEILCDPALPLERDAERRDFTFNALYKRVGNDIRQTARDILGEVFDPTERGMYDLERRLVNTTHPDSFRDDPLRILRALRFVSTLGYDLGTLTHAQMVLHADAVTGLTRKGVSGTALAELEKLLMGDDCAKALRLARDTGVLAVFLPELAPMIGFDQGSRYHDLTTDEHTFKALETAVRVNAPLRVRMALLFHDAGKPAVAWTGKDGRSHYYGMGPTELVRHEQEGIGYRTDSLLDHEVVSYRLWREAAARLNAPKGLRDEVGILVRDHMVTTSTRAAGVRARRMRVKYGDELLHDLLMHRACDISGKGNGGAKEHYDAIAALESFRWNAEQTKVPVNIKDLQINGHDVKALAKDGRDIGRILAAVLDEVVCQPTEAALTREWQLARAEALA